LDGAIVVVVIQVAADIVRVAASNNGLWCVIIVAMLVQSASGFTKQHSLFEGFEGIRGFPELSQQSSLVMRQ